MSRLSRVCIRTILGLTIIVDEIVCTDCMQVFYNLWDVDHHVCRPTSTEAGANLIEAVPSLANRDSA